MNRVVAPLLLALALTMTFTAEAFAGAIADPRLGDARIGTRGGITYVVDRTTSSNPEYVESSAACPALGQGWRILGGGARIDDPAGELSSSRPLDIYPAFGDDDVLSDDYWEITGDAALGEKAASWAICTRSPKIKYVSSEPPDDVSPERSATDACPGRTRLTGGGGFIATTDSYISSMYPSARREWSVRLFDTAGGIGGMRNELVCLRAGLKTVTEDKAMALNEVRTVKASCPANRHVSGGGASVSGSPGGGRLLASYPVDGGDRDLIPDDGWKVKGVNGTAGSLDIAAYAICKR